MNTQTKPALAMIEFVPLMAFMISLVALAIDAMLPALPMIGRDLDVAAVNDQQLVITALFLGLGVAQMIYGPLSDSIGRKPAIYSGLVIFSGGCLISIFATSFDVMLVGRVMQGVGVAAPRIVTIAMVRDQYEGRAMARIMSFVMSVFILVPAIAPALGQGILMLSNWRMIFGAVLLQALVAAIWFGVRQPETLPPARRAPFSLRVIWEAVKETVRNRVSLGYTLVSAMVFGALIGYLISAQQVFAVIYGITDLFPLYFGVLALIVGLASVINGRIVMRLGMRRLVGFALSGMTLTSLAFLVFVASLDTAPELWLIMIYFAALFLCFGFLFGNTNAMAMEPLGHIAGTGAAVIGSLSTLISVALGTLIGQAFDGTVVPLVGGFAMLGALGIGIMLWTEQGRVPEPAVETPTSSFE